MKIVASSLSVLLLASWYNSMTTMAQEHPGAADHCGKGITMTCSMLGGGSSNPSLAVPTLDGNLADWSNVPGGISPELIDLWGKNYNDMGGGTPTFKCLFDDTKIYYMLEIPGRYRFDTEDNHFCASIGTMMPISEGAEYLNMGNCLAAAGGCEGGIIPEECYNNRVDLGAHWELKTTQQGVEYPMNITPPGVGGNDLVANKDDEFAVSPYCRPDDNDALAANEWAGSWGHTNPVEGAMGNYTFELSRLLTTASTFSDTQMKAGEIYDFGIAYWDPYETMETGWSKAGHYLTGCSKDWIKLALDDGSLSPMEMTSPGEPSCVGDDCVKPPVTNGCVNGNCGGYEEPAEEVEEEEPVIVGVEENGGEASYSSSAIAPTMVGGGSAAVILAAVALSFLASSYVF